MNLTEAYKKRVAIAESVYQKSHNGEAMDNMRKVTLARCLKNVDAFLTEAFNSSNATQRADFGDFKKFCLNLTTVALPNLIANDLVIVKPMASYSGYVTYIEYSAGTTKGQTTQGDLFNSPFKLGNVDPNYTSDKVVETFTGANNPVTAAWFPATEARLVSITTNAGVAVPVADDASVTINADGKTFTISNGTGTAINATDTVKVAYVYDNIVVPQNDLPTLKAELKNIPLVAHARRIAVYYSQIAAFEASNDYGFNLGDQLAEKAVGQLQYEIDTEVVNLLVETAGAADAELTWSKTLPIGVSKKEHYEGFTEMISIAAQKIYDKTKRFMPTYMLVASNIIPILNMINGFDAASTANINGPYFAGTLNGMKVFVSPAMTAGDYCLGVNGNDMMSSVAVYAPYMPVVPTQLLQFNDGLTTQGWSTMYDLKVLNADLIVKGAVTA